MAGALNLSQFSLSGPITSPMKQFRSRVVSISIRAMSETSSTSTSVSNQEFAAPPNFKPPEPKRFGIRPDKTSDIFGASLPVFFRFATGIFVSGYSVSFVSKEEIPSDQYALEVGGYKAKETSKLGPRPEKPIAIYEFESCPFCRKVREIVAILDLDVLFYPCPRNGPNFRPKVAEMGGKQQFPYMVDPNTGISMYESDDIIKYLTEKYGTDYHNIVDCFPIRHKNNRNPEDFFYTSEKLYRCIAFYLPLGLSHIAGDGSIPFTLSLGLLTTLTAGFANLGRRGKGTTYTPAKLPPNPLKLWAYEGSPFCKLVREVLVELELPHLLISCARGSPKRQILYEKTGHFQAPYLEDQNTGIEMFESAEIIEYLRATYALQ